MGTSDKDVEDLWQAFDAELANAGLTEAHFARWYYCEVNEWDDELEAKKFAEKLKKQRQRKSTSPRMVANLTDYIHKIQLYQQYEGTLGRIAPRKPDYPELDADFQRRMKVISGQIDDMIEEDREEEI